MGVGSGSAGLLWLVAVAGAGTMVVELAAVRLLAPWFGSSQAVWTNVIGVVLFALALGYFLGSKLAARPQPLAALGWVLAFGAASTAWLPALAAPVADLFMPAGVTLDRAAELFVWGSLASAALLFAPAAVALGCVGPLAVEIVARRSGGHAGSAGGKVLCASTLGSLAGTFGTTHFALPGLGLKGTFLLAGVCLGVLSLISFVFQRRATWPGIGALVCVVLSFAAATRTPSPTGTLLAEVQSAYQTVRVVETGAGAERMRQLQVNEGLDSFQSVWQPESGLLPVGYYYNYFCLPPWWSGAQGTWRVMVLGLGAGTSWRVLEGSLPAGVRLVATGAEIDPAVIDLAREFLELAPQSPERQTLAGWDARAALRAMQGQFDEIILDTYANQMEMPAHLCSVEFFREVRGRLAPGGWLAINIGGFSLNDPVVQAVAATAATAFQSAALCVRVPFSRNVVAYLKANGTPFVPGDSGWSLAEGPVAKLLPPVEISSRWALIHPATPAPLSDDRNPIERLQAQSILLAAQACAEREER